MIIKPHYPPSSLLQYEVLSRRIPQEHLHKQFIVQQFKNLRIGYQGERSLDFPLQFLNEHDFYIFHNLRLQDHNGFFQIDTLIVNESFFLMIEVKNIHGTIEFDHMGQAIRTRDDGTEERFIHPLDQIKLQEKRFHSWLRKHDFQQIPLEKVVVYTNPRTILKNSSHNQSILNSIIHQEKLQTKIETIKATYPNPVITTNKIKRLSSLLLEKHADDDRRIMDVLNIQQHDLLTGVFCPDCNSLPMIRKRKKWHCPLCGMYASDSHIDALKDYHILFGPSIKNRQARHFLHIDSPHVTKRLLMKSKILYEGDTSSRVYHLSPFI